VFVLNGKPLALDVAFEANDTLYPANWLRLASPTEREAVGITEVPDPPVYDQRFYWGYTASGTLIPKDHGVLVSGWSDQTSQTAYTLLLPTDWQIVRQMDDGTRADPMIVAWRQNIRQATSEKISCLQSTTTTDELASYVTGSGYPVWPQLNPPVPPTPDPSGVVFNNLATSDSLLTDNSFVNLVPSFTTSSVVTF
jgi:hypothetical protein